MSRGPIIWKILLAALLTACSHPSELRSPLFSSYRPGIRSILILPPEIDVLEQLPDGSLVRREDYGRAAGDEAVRALSQSLSGKELSARLPGEAVLHDPETHEVKSLFRAVNRSIQRHTQGSQAFPDKLRNFNFEMGSVDRLLKKGGADGLLLTIGQQMLSGERSSLRLSMAVVEPQGHIIWYNSLTQPLEGRAFTTQPVQQLVNDLLQPFTQGVQ